MAHLHSNETFEVLYNTIHGDWTPSKQALKLYNERMQQIDPDFTPIPMFYYDMSRDDPVLVEIFHTLGSEFDEGNYVCRTKSVDILVKYKAYYYIQKNGGKETVMIDMIKYELDTVKEILNDTAMNEYEKIMELNRLFGI
jgi:hypothetical protein